MRALANFILLGVGYQHWYRMNVLRLPHLYRGRVWGPEDFLRDLSARIGGHGAELWKHEIGCAQLYQYLHRRLCMPGRLALPDGYDLGADRDDVS